MNEDNKIATISDIRDKDSASNELMNIIEEIKANLKDGEKRAVPYYAIKDIKLLQVTSAYDDNQLVKLSDISYSGTPSPEDPIPPIQETYNYNIPVNIKNIIIQDGINQNDIEIEFRQNDNFIARIGVPNNFIDITEEYTTPITIPLSSNTEEPEVDIIIDFDNNTFRDNCNIMCVCNGIKETSLISSSGGGQTKIILENVRLMYNNGNYENTIIITIGAAS